MIEIYWGEPLSLVSPDGEHHTFSTFEKARYRLRRKWPVADKASHDALCQIDAAMDCMIPADFARTAFVAAARSAGFSTTNIAPTGMSLAA